jgi:hypothetical protein
MRNLFASENKSKKLRHVSDQNFGGLCWFGHRILVLIGSLNPSYAEWVILLPLNGVMSDREMAQRKIRHAFIFRCCEVIKFTSTTMDMRDTSFYLSFLGAKDWLL